MPSYSEALRDSPKQMQSTDRCNVCGQYHQTEDCAQLANLTADDRVKKLKEIKSVKGKSSAVFKLKEDIVGGKSTDQEQTAMKDHKTKELLFEPKKILDAGLKYVTDLLQNRLPSEECEREIKILELRMEEPELEDESESL